jgi:hypothetical protein
MNSLKYRELAPPLGGLGGKKKLLSLNLSTFFSSKKKIIFEIE